MKELSQTAVPDRVLMNLEQVASQAKDLPPMPVTALKALEMTNDPNVSARALQEVISRDQALSARMLRIVNSPLFCLSREVSTLSHAITLLGMESVRSILMAAGIHQVVQRGLANRGDLGTKLLADHSWGAGIAARAIALKTKYSNPEEAFLCGLMHDIGKPVLLKNYPAQYNQIFSEVYSGRETFHQAELRLFGFSHAHVGALIADKWKFPPQMVEGIGYHHNPLSAPKCRQLACVINLSNLLMIRMEVGFEKDKSLDLPREASVESLGLSQSSLEAVIVEVQEACAAMPDTMKY